MAAISAMALALAVASCAAQASTGGDHPTDSGAPPSGVVSSGPLPLPGPGATAPTPHLVRPESAVELRRERWAHVEAVAGTADVLVYGTFSGGPPCTVLGKVEVVEEGGRVTIGLWVGRRPDARCDGPQEQLGYPFVTRVGLTAPIGARPVLDAAG